ncbi:leucine rich repeat-containing protein [Toxoplasma gondii RUB]|uniref:Leucine rich repeat-containing protein n=1 Tax=Toxoplasma gondii RUB TaxID=935652 RepID=A0A086LP98_TOXGO|nr:leucine rich repeat-containing protein [Toxoplasma gondii RUB]
MLSTHNGVPAWRVLRVITGHFDPSTVYVFNGQNTCVTLWQHELQLCRNLLFLNISNCELTSISAIVSLTSLRHLDISYNSLVKLDNVNKLRELENLRAVANPISRFQCAFHQDLRDLSGLECLKALSFQNVDGTDACPVCRLGDYRARIYYLLPQVAPRSFTSKTETKGIVTAQICPGTGVPLTALRTRLRSLDGVRVHLPDINAKFVEGTETLEKMRARTAQLRDRTQRVCLPAVLDFPPFEAGTSVSSEFTPCVEHLASLREAVAEAKEVLALFEKLSMSVEDKV